MIVWKKHQIFSSAITKFIEEIKSAFKEKLSFKNLMKSGIKN